MYNTFAKVTAFILVLTIILVVYLASSVLNVNNDAYQLSNEQQAKTVAEPNQSETAEVSQQDSTTELMPSQSDSEIVAPVEEVIEQATQTSEVPATTPEEEIVEEATSTETNTSGEAQIHVVTAEGLKYNPLVIEIQPGDTVAWENMSSHDTQSMEGLIPEGAEAWHSGMGENYQRTFDVEGIYVYKCTPHFGAGMGGAIIVGKPVNLEAIKSVSVKGAAKRLVKKAVKAAEAM